MSGHCAHLNGVGKRFGDVWVLRDVTLALPAQRTTAIEERLYDGLTADADRSHAGPYQVVDFSMDYIYKLWLAHGLTTVRAVGSHRGGLTWTVEQRWSSQDSSRPRKRALRKARCPWEGFSALRFRLHAPP